MEIILSSGVLEMEGRFNLPNDLPDEDEIRKSTLVADGIFYPHHISILGGLH